MAGLPIIHSGLVREKSAYGRELKTLRKVLGHTPLTTCLIPVPQTFVFPNRRNFGVIFIGAGLTLLPKLRRIKPDLVHCRSFLSTFIASDLRRRAGLDYKIIYDALSLWPEMQYRRYNDAEDLAMFRQMERDIVYDVDAVVAVNDAMRDHYAQMGAGYVITNYIAASMAPDYAPRLRAPGQPIRLVYAGALYEGGMQTPQMLFKLASAVQHHLGRVHLTVLTTSPHAPLQTLAQKYLDTDQFHFEAVRDPARMPLLLAKADFACNVYRKPVTEIDMMLCATGLSTKSAEYLSAGLPILVSSYPEAIGRLVNDNKVGCTFDETRADFGLSAPQLEALMTVQTRQRAAKLARHNFDRRVVAKRFAELYRHVTDRTP
ncbi:MAG: glycosyltransferase [Pseudomonadota bacterium]